MFIWIWFENYAKDLYACMITFWIAKYSSRIFFLSISASLNFMYTFISLGSPSTTQFFSVKSTQILIDSVKVSSGSPNSKGAKEPNSMDGFIAFETGGILMLTNA